jgi:hypothetical protein
MIWLALLAQAGLANPSNLYLPSPDQVRIDRSFSMIGIDTPLIVARLRLKEDRTGDWMDRDGVRYTFRGDNPNRLYLVAKTVRASDYVWKSIPALGIGHARERALVMASVQRQVRGAPFDCQPSQQAADFVTCRAQLKPGWVAIDFDAGGQLFEAQLVGYDVP